MQNDNQIADTPAQAAARAWLHSYGINTNSYVEGGWDHPAMKTLPQAFEAFATPRAKGGQSMPDNQTAALIVQPSAREPLPRELVKEIAMEIGKEVASHIETMYPAAVAATSRSMLLSLRNSVHNDIMAAVDALESGDAVAWIERRRAQRRKSRALWRQHSADAATVEGDAIYENGR